MPARRDPGTKVETKLAGLRVQRGITQKEMAEATGLSLSHYVRLEHGRIANPGIRHLANCAVVLGVRLDRILEDDWKRWMAFTAEAADPPPTVLWRKKPRQKNA